MRTAIPVARARFVRTSAAAAAVGFAYSLFVCAYFDPVAIGWFLAPFIGAFWGALLGGLAGLALRLVATAVLGAPDREVPVMAAAAAVTLVAVLTSLALAQYGAVAESFIGPEVGWAARVGAGLLPAVVVALAYWHSSHRSPRRRS